MLSAPAVGAVLPAVRFTGEPACVTHGEPAVARGVLFGIAPRTHVRGAISFPRAFVVDGGTAPPLE